MLPRMRLLNQMLRSLRTGHLLIEAPGGYGKTIILQDLAAQRPSTYYYAITPVDVDIATLEHRFDMLMRQPGSTLILDDIHHLNDEPEALTWLTAHLEQPSPHHARLVISGRFLDLPGSTLLIARRALTRYTASDLAFTRIEARTLGIPDAWWQRTEGWPLALALYQQLATQQAAPLDPMVQGGAIFDSLAQMLFADLPADLRRFMLISAVPTRFNLALAAFLLDETPEQAAEWLSAVQRHALFVYATEPSGWQRYHDLIREFLLQQHDPTPYWQRSMAWFEQQNDLPLAIEHALAGGLHDEAARLLETLAETFVSETGRYRTFRRWVLGLAQAQQAAHPLLLLRLGSDLQELGLRDEARQIFERAYGYARELDRDTQAQVSLGIALAHADDGAPETALPLLETLLDDPELSPQLRRAVFNALGGVHYYLSQLPAARSAYQRALAIDAETPQATTYRIRQNLVNIALIPLGAFDEAQRQLALNEASVKPQLIAYIWHLLTVCWLNEAMGNWEILGQTLDEVRQTNLKTEANDEEDTAELMLRAIYNTGVGNFDKAASLLDRISTNTIANPDIALYTALCRAWLARRMGEYQSAVAITNEALAQPWNVPLTRSMLAMEREMAQFALGMTQNELHPEVRHLLRFRARHWLLRLRVLLALRCHRNSDPRWRHHAEAVLRQIKQPGYERLLITREPDLGAYFWALLVAEDIALVQANAALAQLGTLEPVLVLLQRNEPAIIARAAQALAAIGDERAIPALADHGGSSVERALTTLEHVPPPLLRIKLMGQFAVTRGERMLEAEDWTRPAARRLFQYLALNAGRRILRDQIIDDLWPDGGTTAARNSLKTTLSWLRKAIEPYLRPKSPARYYTAENEVYAFGVGTFRDRIIVDTVEFTRIVGDALQRAAEQELPTVSDEMLAALRSWEPLLPDLHGETWSLAPRERLRDLYVRGCLYAAEAFLTISRPVDAEQWSRQAISAAPWSEEGYQLLIRSQARQGQRSQALRSYADAVAALEREFDAAPSDLTEWLATRLRRGEEI